MKSRTHKRGNTEFGIEWGALGTLRAAQSLALATALTLLVQPLTSPVFAANSATKGNAKVAWRFVAESKTDAEDADGKPDKKEAEKAKKEADKAKKDADKKAKEAAKEASAKEAKAKKEEKAGKDAKKADAKKADKVEKTEKVEKSEKAEKDVKKADDKKAEKDAKKAEAEAKKANATTTKDTADDDAAKKKKRGWFGGGKETESAATKDEPPKSGDTKNAESKPAAKTAPAAKIGTPAAKAGTSASPVVTEASDAAPAEKPVFLPDRALVSVLQDISKSLGDVNAETGVETDDEKLIVGLAKQILDKALGSGEFKDNRILAPEQNTSAKNSMTTEAWASGDVTISEKLRGSVATVWGKRINGSLHVTVAGDCQDKTLSNGDKVGEFIVVIRGRSPVKSGFDIQSQTDVTYWIGALNNVAVENAVLRLKDKAEGEEAAEQASDEKQETKGEVKKKSTVVLEAILTRRGLEYLQALARYQEQQQALIAQQTAEAALSDSEGSTADDTDLPSTGDEVEASRGARSSDDDEVRARGVRRARSSDDDEDGDRVARRARSLDDDEDGDRVARRARSSDDDEDGERGARRARSSDDDEDGDRDARRTRIARANGGERGKRDSRDADDDRDSRDERFDKRDAKSDRREVDDRDVKSERRRDDDRDVKPNRKNDARDDEAERTSKVSHKNDDDDRDSDRSARRKNDRKDDRRDDDRNKRDTARATTDSTKNSRDDDDFSPGRVAQTPGEAQSTKANDSSWRDDWSRDGGENSNKLSTVAASKIPADSNSASTGSNSLSNTSYSSGSNSASSANYGSGSTPSSSNYGNGSTTSGTNYSATTPSNTNNIASNISLTRISMASPVLAPASATSSRNWESPAVNPAPKAPSLDAALLIPERAIAGQFLTVSVMTKDHQPERAVELSFNGATLATDLQGQVSYMIPDDMPPGNTLHIGLAERPELNPRVVDILQPLDDVSSQKAPRIDRVSQLVAADGVLVIDGHDFDGFANRNRIMIDNEEPAKVIAASPVQLRVLVPNKLSPGSHSVTINSTALRSTPAKFDFVKADVIPDDLRKTKGVLSKLVVRVQGTKQPVAVRVVNRTPDVIKMSKGDNVIVTTSGGTDNSYVVGVKQLKKGDYKIDTKIEI